MVSTLLIGSPWIDIGLMTVIREQGRLRSKVSRRIPQGQTVCFSAKIPAVSTLYTRMDQGIRIERRKLVLAEKENAKSQSQSKLNHKNTTPVAKS